MDFVWKIFENWGPIAGLIAFIMWRDFKREDRMTAALDKASEKFIELLRQSIKATGEHTAAINSFPCRMESLGESQVRRRSVPGIQPERDK